MEHAHVATLVTKVQQAAVAARHEAAERLRKILVQSDPPSETDHQTLAKCMDVLGIPFTQLPDVLQTVQKLDRYESLLADRDNRMADKTTTFRELQALDAWRGQEYAKIDREYDQRKAPLTDAHSAATGRVIETEEARRWHETVKAKWLAIVEGITEEQAMDRLRGR